MVSPPVISDKVEISGDVVRRRNISLRRLQPQETKNDYTKSELYRAEVLTNPHRPPPLWVGHAYHILRNTCTSLNKQTGVSPRQNVTIRVTCRRDSHTLCSKFVPIKCRRDYHKKQTNLKSKVAGPTKAQLQITQGT